MNNLRLELLSLEQEEYNISEDFTNKIMSKIKKQNKIKTFQKVASVLSVACSFTICFIIANDKGIINLNKYIDLSGASSAVQSFSNSINKLVETKDASNIKIASSSVENEETVNTLNNERATLTNTIDNTTDGGDSTTDISIEDEFSNDESLLNASFDSTNNEEDTLAMKDNSEIESGNILNTQIAKTEKTYLKKMTKEDYFKSIEDTLKEKKYKYEIKDNIISIDAKIDEVYETLKEFLDAVIVEENGKVIVYLDE